MLGLVLSITTFWSKLLNTDFSLLRLLFRVWCSGLLRWLIYCMKSHHCVTSVFLLYWQKAWPQNLCFGRHLLRFSNCTSVWTPKNNYRFKTCVLLFNSAPLLMCPPCISLGLHPKSQYVLTHSAKRVGKTYLNDLLLPAKLWTAHLTRPLWRIYEWRWRDATDAGRSHDIDNMPNVVRSDYIHTTH